jgi:hypothetical protein
MGHSQDLLHAAEACAALESEIERLMPAIMDLV